MDDPNASTHLPPAGADGRQPVGPPDFERRIDAERRAKDAWFRDSPRSPLPPEERRGFSGLAYFAPDASLRFEGLGLERIGETDDATFAIETSDRRPRMAHRLGRLRVTIGGRDLTLTAYRIDGGSSTSLFVPFRDETTGSETYGAGRYLDISADDDGTFVVDFNEAYHPFCAYSDAYSCPLPPTENWLPVRIEAGERLDPRPDHSDAGAIGEGAQGVRPDTAAG